MKKFTDFVEAGGGRQGNESLADASARLLGVSTRELRAALKEENTGSDFLAAIDRFRNANASNPDETAEQPHA